MQSPDLLGTFVVPLEKSGIPYFITGSIASIFYGEPRLTHDVDIVINLSQSDILQFISLFPLDTFYCPPIEVIRIESKRRPFGHFNLIHHETGLKADLYPDADDRLHQWAFQNRRRIDFEKNLALWVAPPEYIIIRKLEYFREGSSEKHIEDLRKMLPQVDADLNQSYLQAELKKRGLIDYWARVNQAKEV